MKILAIIVAMIYPNVPHTSARDRPAAARRRRELIAACAVTAAGMLIVAVLLASRPAVPTSTATSTGPEAAAAANPSAPVLGTRLGAISFETRAAGVLRILGEPQRRSLAHGMGTPVWEYANGLVVYLQYGRGSQTPEVWKLVARPPFQGATAERFRLGDSEAEFARVYRDYPVRSFPNTQPTQMVILDSKLRKLVAAFGPDGTAISLSLTDSCTTCDPASGTPGPKKTP